MPDFSMNESPPSIPPTDPGPKRDDPRVRGSELNVILARGVITEQVVVHLPASAFTVSLPDGVVMDIPEASFRFTVRTEGTSLVFKRELVIKALVITADHCGAFAGFLNKANRAEHSMAVMSAQEDTAAKEEIMTAK